MKLIAHRGNINGKIPNKENHPDYIKLALSNGYDVEIDVWYDNGYWLGHDEPIYNIDKDFLLNDKFWCHAKNGNALYNMLQDGIHCFWHQEDDYTLTSCGKIWTYPNKQLYYNSICVLPELGINGDIKQCYGICSDDIQKYKLKTN
tara:strand:- start:661 stop:1098 length:438 start_codon:yes stop_codon:yes gene_type:complete